MKDNKRRIFFSPHLIACLTCAAVVVLSPALLYSGIFQGTIDHNNDIENNDFNGRRSQDQKNEISKPQPLKISIKSSILMLLENNHALNVERINPLIQKTFEDQERAAFDPVVSADFSYDKEKRVETTSDPNGFYTTSEYVTNQTDVDADVSEFLPTGTKISLGLTADRTWSDLYGDQHIVRAGLNISQALLKGAGVNVNLASLRQARLDTFSSQYEFRGFTESIISEVEKTYWDYALAQQRIRIFNESLNLAEKQMIETEERIKIGILSEIELAAAQAEVALRKEDLINARSDLAKFRLNLLYLLNPSGSDLWDREIVLVDQPSVPDITVEAVQYHVEIGLIMRSDLSQAKLQLQKGELEIIKTKNGLLPKMDFFITLGKSGYSDSFEGSVKDLDGRRYDIAAGINIGYPIFNRDAKARHHRAILDYSQAEEAVKNLAQIVQMDVRSAYIEVKRTSEQVLATAATQKLQKEKLRAETEKFRVGKSTSLLVAQAQRDLTASSISEIQSIVGYLKALVELYRLEGSLLERRGISLNQGDLPNLSIKNH